MEKGGECVSDAAVYEVYGVSLCCISPGTWRELTRGTRYDAPRRIPQLPPSGEKAISK